MAKADIGLIGLAVMGENLVMNIESKGFSVCVYNRTVQKVTDFINGRAKGKNITGAHSLEELVDGLKTPRKIMLMVKAGDPVDKTIEALIPLIFNRSSAACGITIRIFSGSISVTTTAQPR